MEITSHHMWFLLAVTYHGPKRTAHNESPPYQHWLAWHHDFVLSYGSAANPADEALAIVQAALN